MAALWLMDLIKYHDENRKLRQQVAELSWDEPFGMLTRPAFLQLCRQLPVMPRWVAFLDMNNIGSLNLAHGYTEVDRRIRALFAGFRNRQDIVARWYSGDEIVILFAGSKSPQAAMIDLVAKAGEVGLEFIYQTGVWDSRHGTIEQTVNGLSRSAGRRKYYNKNLSEN